MQPPSSEQPASPPRRSFVKKIAAGIIGGVITLVPGLAGLMVLFDPVKRKSTAGKGEILVARLSALPADGVPRRFSVIMDRVDAWNTYKNVPVGGVFLRRTADNKVTALNASCPHAGCSVRFSGTDEKFVCPCHDSLFEQDGAIANQSSPSPRGLDSLTAEVRNENEVWVKFENFQPGHKEKVPVT
jgi:menaquinol-cytochrome c reductase iron-sulfur subunit